MAKPKRQVIIRYRQARGKWEVDHPNPPGALARRSRPLFATEEEALAYAAEVAKRPNDGAPVVADRDILLRDYTPKFLAARQPDIAARTHRGYSQSLESYVLPTLGHFKIREVRRRHIKPWLSSLKQRGLAPDTVRLAKAALSALLSHAVDEEIIDTNPALQLGRTRGTHAGKLTTADREEHIRPFESVQQRDEFLKASAQFRPHGVAFEVMAKAGLRPGEAYALQPDDLNLKARTMRVERALDIDRTEKPTKT